MGDSGDKFRLQRRLAQNKNNKPKVKVKTKAEESKAENRWSGALPFRIINGSVAVINAMMRGVCGV